MKNRILAFLLTLFLFPTLSFAASYTVKGVLDGDTVQVRSSDGQEIRVRFYGLDCLETSHRGKPGQAYGNIAKRRVNELIRNQQVELETYGKGPYGRTIAVVWSGGVNINETLMKESLAWTYKRYCKESFCNQWLDLESRARQNGLGLFADQNPTPPWTFRHK